MERRLKGVVLWIGFETSLYREAAYLSLQRFSIITIVIVCDREGRNTSNESICEIVMPFAKVG